MRYLVPRPRPDELLSSVWMRTVRRAGLPVRLVAQALTHGRKWAPGFFQVAHVGDLAEVLQMPAIELLWRHTVFPYATAFLERPVYENALASAMATGLAAVGMGAVTQSVSDGVRFRRYCVACARLDFTQWGESYWRRAHNLPGVLVCLEHQALLREAPQRTVGRDTWSPTLPHEVPRRMARTPPTEFDLELARRSVARLDRDVGPPTPRGAAWYRRELYERGLVSVDRQVNAERLAAWARAQIGGGAGARKYGLAEKDDDLGWLALMVRPHSMHPVIPVKHLIFETALALQGPSETPVLDHVPSGLSARPAEELDKRFAKAVMAVVRDHLQRGERVRVHDALTLAGCWATYRHHRARFPRTQEVVWALRNSQTRARMVPRV